MTKIKTRLEAKTASIKKWNDILTRIEKIRVDTESNCGFCNLAQYKSKKSGTKIYRCTFCEADAEKLCRRYITDDRLIVDSLTEAWDVTTRLLNQILALPDVLKE